MSAENPSFNQIEQQFKAGHKEPTVLVERSGEKISTGRYTGKQFENGSYEVKVTMVDGKQGYREVSSEALTDTKQAELAEALTSTRPASEIVTGSEQQHEPRETYYISEKGTVWSPMEMVGTVSDTQGKVQKYILGNPSNLSEMKEVPADWLDANKDALLIKEGETWSPAGKPSLETPVLAEASPERSQVAVAVRGELGHDALGASGVEEPESKAAQLDRILDKAPVLRHFESELRKIAKMRRREEDEGYRDGMDQFASSRRMIDDLLKLAGQVEKPKTMSEDREGTILRYIDHL